MLFFVRIPGWVYFWVYGLSCVAIVVYVQQATTGLGSWPLEVPQFLRHENRRAPENKGRSGDFRFALSENPAMGARRRSLSRGKK